jgi:hypothetical protein
MPNPDKPELKIEDCKLNIGGCRFAPSFLKWKEFLKYSIFNRKYSIVKPPSSPPLDASVELSTPDRGPPEM